MSSGLRTSVQFETLGTQPEPATGCNCRAIRVTKWISDSQVITLEPVLSYVFSHEDSRKCASPLAHTNTTIHPTHVCSNAGSSSSQLHHCMLSKKVYHLVRSLWPGYRGRPIASDVLRFHFRRRRFPSVTSFFIPYSDIQDEHFGRPLRISGWNTFFSFLKVANLGFPCLVYGVAATFMVKECTEYIVNGRRVRLFFLLSEVDD
uniref:Uncharacterized protein n=1 Tax=Trichuris muris TaxID=70415 RepID=A0A5S6QKI1_TRIMR